MLQKLNNIFGSSKIGAIPFSGLPELIFWAMFAVVFFIFLGGGGFTTAFKLGAFVSKVPVWIWAILIILFLFGGKKK